ncbi:beta-1,4 N-acetylgalactosaminyltransferase 2-like isoform X1 [Simochromis diagramma]|uniref:beta-1,4 N-acetylgalactosaminyltransferase 2-like isoform X1 n=1 Tax=Simochromis diagramma TaxID=43689 RepID=UPI001A7EEE41|nr:beta-1,4 N-acetylgalactosaminyltransferase 2-like isoform X1 [Simochromis diagramma]
MGGTLKMFVFDRWKLQVVSAVCVIVVTTSYFILTKDVITTPKLSSSLPTHLPSSGPCTCPAGSRLLKEHLPKDQYEELVQRRTKEFQQYKARTTSVLSKLLFALPNSPLQYPIQGYTVQPLSSSVIPGLQLHAGKRSSYKVVLKVSKGILTTDIPPAEVTVEGSGEKELIIKSRSLELLNDVLVKVSYTSTVYHINTGDLVTFQFENHEAVFAIAIKQPHVPVLYDMGTGASGVPQANQARHSSFFSLVAPFTSGVHHLVRGLPQQQSTTTLLQHFSVAASAMKNISSQVTIATKTFLRYEQLMVLLDSIRKFYSTIKVIVADDNFEPEHITGENIQHYIMPPAQGWFAGRNLAVSQVTTKYFLWVDDDFLFTEKTKIEKLVEVMEANPELDVVGGSLKENQFYFSLIYEEGEETEGGCLYRKSNKKLHSVPGYPQCFLASGVVNFFLARTDAVQRVGFDPKLQRIAHSEFFMDGLGYLLVATCGDVSIDHQHVARSARYRKFRNPRKDDSEFKLQLHFFKNHLKCIKYG